MATGDPLTPEQRAELRRIAEAESVPVKRGCDRVYCRRRLDPLAPCEGFPCDCLCHSSQTIHVPVTIQLFDALDAADAEAARLREALDVPGTHGWFAPYADGTVPDDHEVATSLAVDDLTADFVGDARRWYEAIRKARAALTPTPEPGKEPTK